MLNNIADVINLDSLRFGLISISNEPLEVYAVFCMEMGNKRTYNFITLLEYVGLLVLRY